LEFEFLVGWNEEVFNVFLALWAVMSFFTWYSRAGVKVIVLAAVTL
jgi:hypothetical protein